MNTPALLLHALKGTCALNCLAALHLAGPLPVTQRVIMDLTGFDDRAVSKGLNTLLVLDLATCTGGRHRTSWQLAPAAQRLPLPLHPFLSSRLNVDSQALLKEEEDKERQISDTLDSSTLVQASNPAFAESAPTLHPAPTKSFVPTLARASAPPLLSSDRKSPQEPASTHLTCPTTGAGETLESPAPGHSRGLSPRPLRTARGVSGGVGLRSEFYAAFEAANVYLQFRRPLADALIAGDDGPAWLRQTLGWLCYAQRRLPHVKQGAVVYISLRDRLPCDPAYLPPPELPFDLALAWALRGGEAEPEAVADTNDENDINDINDDNDDKNKNAHRTLRAPEAQRVLPGPEEPLWRAVIERLARELPAAVIDSQLRPARLVSLDGDRCRIAAPTPQSRDWLQTRLAGVLARAVCELTGRVLAIEVVVDM